MRPDVFAHPETTGDHVTFVAWGATVPAAPDYRYYRNCVLGQMTHPDIRAYWFDEYALYNERYRIEVTSSTLNKVRRLLVPRRSG